MSEVIANEKIALPDLMDFFSTATGAAGDNGSVMAGKAVRSLVASAGNDSRLQQAGLETFLTDWLAGLQLKGLTVNTAVSYLKAISGLYTKAVKAGIAPETDVFRKLKASLRNNRSAWDNALTLSDFQRMQNLTRASAFRKDGSSAAADAVLLSLLLGAMPVAGVANLRTDDVAGEDDAVRAVAARNAGDTNRSYVFNLRSDKPTPNQVREKLELMLADLFGRYNIKTWGSADETLRSYWGFAAVLAGVRPHVAASALGSAPSGLPAFSLFGVKDADPELREEIKPVVGRVFASDSLRWYAMHLRRKTSFADVRERFERLRGIISTPEMFYPCEELSRRIGKRIVFEEKPIIRDIVFFRSRTTDVSAIFSHIGDLAWCLTAGGKGTAYAAIPQKSFDDFQEAVGKFTPQYLLAHPADMSLKEGDDVLVIGGLFKDSKAQVVKVGREGPDSIVSYLVHICNDLTDRCNANVDPRLLRKIPVDKIG